MVDKIGGVEGHENGGSLCCEESHILDTEMVDKEVIEKVERSAHCGESEKLGMEVVGEEIVVSLDAASELVASKEVFEKVDQSGKLDTETVDKEVVMSHIAGREHVLKDVKDASQNLGVEETEASPGNVKMPLGDDLEVTVQSGLTESENKAVSLLPDEVKPESTENDANHDCGKVGDTNKKRKGKVVSQVTSSWSLRSRTQEKVEAPEPTEAVEGSGSGENIRRCRKKKRRKRSTSTNTNEYSRTRSQLKYLLHRIKYEQSLIDAYSTEGWKGRSLDKLKPEKELQRAKSHIIRYKLRIRDLFQQLDPLLEVGKLPESLFDDQGEIDSEDIFCAKCGSKDLPLDNDIILCDGACERGFHQFCMDPPLLNEDIPPGDEDWFCSGCDCKDDCIDELNEFNGTNITLLDNWEKIFPEAAEAASGNQPDDESYSDGEDDHYDPNKPDAVDKVERVKSSSDNSGYFSAPDKLAAPNNEDYMGLPSEDSEDDDFDPDGADPDKQAKQSSSSSDFSSESEDFGALLDDAAAHGDDTEHVSPPSDPNQPCKTREEEDSKVGRRKRPSLKDELSHLMENSDQPVSGRRHVERLDYKKLYDEEYGNNSSDSSDEDFNDTKASKSRKVKRQRTEAISPKKPEITENEGTPQLSKRTRKSIANGGVSSTSDTVGSSGGSSKRTRKFNAIDGVSATSDTVDSASGSSKRSGNRRLGETVTQRMYESFRENQYPERAVKEQLANELGLSIQQVSKWFVNARWSFKHRPRMESCMAEKLPDPQPAAGTENISSEKAVEMQESDTSAPQKHIADEKVENIGAKTSAGK